MTKKFTKKGNNKKQEKNFQEQLEELKSTLPDEETSEKEKTKRVSSRNKKDIYKEDTEVWVALYGYEDTHQISSYGNVRSMGRTIQDKNGFYRELSGKQYKMKPDDEYIKFSKEGKLISLKLSDALGKSFYEPNSSYNFINSFSDFNDNEKDKFHSLDNIASIKDVITIIDENGNEETTNGFIKLTLYLNKKYNVSLLESSFVSAKKFEVDEMLGLVIKGIPGIPEDVEIIIRKSKFRDNLIELHKKYSIINTGSILDEENLGMVFTGKQVKNGLERIIEKGNSLKFRYAMGMLKKYFIEGHTNEMTEYVIVQLPNNNNSFFIKLVSLRSLSNIEGEIKYKLHENTLKKIEGIKLQKQKQADEIKRLMEEAEEKKLHYNEDNFKLYYVKEDASNCYLGKNGEITNIPKEAKLFTSFLTALSEGRKVFDNAHILYLKFK